MYKIMTKQYFFFLFVLTLLSSPYPTQAARKSKSVKDDNGMKITISCLTDSSFVSENFHVYVLIELLEQPVNVVKLFGIDVMLRLQVNGSEERAKKTVRFPDVNQNLSRGNYVSLPYKNSWGKVTLQLQLRFFVDNTNPLPSLAMKTEWLNFLTLRGVGSYATNFDWIFIILGTIVIISIGLALYKRYLK